MKRTASLMALFMLLLLGEIAAARAVERVEVSGQSGITVPVLFYAVKNPSASIILFTGGDGSLRDEKGSFLLRIQPRFTAAGMNVAVPDTPSDHPGGFGPLFRTWSAHIEDIAAIIAFLKQRSPAPVWAVGTSNGTISTSAGAAALGPKSIFGIVLTSSVWLGGLGEVPIEKIQQPVLIVHDTGDQCPASLFKYEEANAHRFVAVPERKVVPLTGAYGVGPRCGTGSPHDFWGIDGKAVPPILAFIKAHG